jgi:predicted RNase H-like nuclease (RuvC/YqgF family)
MAIQALEKQISQYKKKVHAEKQFNRKVELNQQLKNLKCELEELLA